MKANSSLLVLLTVTNLSACAIPQQVEIIEREQRRMRNDISSMQSDLEAIRGNQADSRAVKATKESKISKGDWLNSRKTSQSVTKNLDSFMKRLKRRKRNSARKLPQQWRSSPKAIWRSRMRFGRITKRHGVPWIERTIK